MPFFTRIGLASLTFALLTGLLILRGPQVQNVSVIAQGPNGSDIPASAVMSMTFSRPVDHASAEQSVVIVPAVAGAFSWQGNTLTFQPGQPLAPNTAYRVTIRSGLSDAQGRPNRSEISWSFRTRGPQLLVVAAGPGGAGTLTWVAPDGSEPRTLLTIAEGILGMAVAPDSGTVVVSVLRSSLRTALIIVNLADGSARPLVDDPEVSAGAPVWSRNQDYIAYVHRPVLDDQLGQTRIWLAHPDGTSYGPILNSENLSFAPVWSPDGNQLAFVNGASADVGIYQFFSDSQRTLAAGSGEPATWAPDGSAIAYTATLPDQPGVPMVIRRWDLAEERSSDLTDGRTSDHGPAWSPEGGQIAFVRSAEDPAANGIWVMAPDGGGQRQLTRSAQDTRPVWSPDSKQLAVIRIGGANAVSSLWVIDVATGAAHQVLEGAVEAQWLP